MVRALRLEGAIISQKGIVFHFIRQHLAEAAVKTDANTRWHLRIQTVEKFAFCRFATHRRRWHEEDAIRIANDTPYGLAAYIESLDLDRVDRVAARLRAGQIHVNGVDCAYGSPFGGYRMSGLGREGGRYGLEDFLEIKVVSRIDR